MNYVGIHKKGEFTLSDLITLIKSRPDFHRAGAIATFVGVVRGTTLDGENVEGLELEAYEEQANNVLGEICEDLKTREGVVDVQIHHFVGKFKVGEDLVYVVVTGGHRQNVFGVLQEAVERYKSEAPVYKKEHTITETGAKESYWVSEREAQKRRKK
ncbi:MAG: molybdenum cofactor biosynthesis protein MoaE [Candidatus Bathyarchaeota archaeon]|nr:molybdenum cofactor biosynthesis protein MoaE [Candidatus Bathyarchaeum sp.]